MGGKGPDPKTGPGIDRPLRSKDPLGAIVHPTFMVDRVVRFFCLLMSSCISSELTLNCFMFKNRNFSKNKMCGHIQYPFIRICMTSEDINKYRAKG